MKRTIENTSTASSFIKDLAIAKFFSAELNSKILTEDGRASTIGIEETEHFIVKDVTKLGGLVRLIDETNQKEFGASTISGDKLPKNKGFVFDRIGVYYGKGDATKKGSVKFTETMIAQLLSATLIFRQNGRTVFERPISSLIARGIPQDPTESYIELNVPSALADDSPYEINLQFAKGVSMPDEESAVIQHLVKVAYLGYSTKLKAA